MRLVSCSSCPFSLTHSFPPTSAEVLACQRFSLSRRLFSPSSHALPPTVCVLNQVEFSCREFLMCECECDSFLNFPRHSFPAFILYATHYYLLWPGLSMLMCVCDVIALIHNCFRAPTTTSTTSYQIPGVPNHVVACVAHSVVVVITCVPYCYFYSCSFLFLTSTWCIIISSLNFYIFLFLFLSLFSLFFDLRVWMCALCIFGFLLCVCVYPYRRKSLLARNFKDKETCSNEDDCRQKISNVPSQS